MREFRSTGWYISGTTGRSCSWKMHTIFSGIEQGPYFNYCYCKSLDNNQEQKVIIAQSELLTFCPHGSLNYPYRWPPAQYSCKQGAFMISLWTSGNRDGQGKLSKKGILYCHSQNSNVVKKKQSVCIWIIRNQFSELQSLEVTLKNIKMVQDHLPVYTRDNSPDQVGC